MVGDGSGVSQGLLVVVLKEEKKGKKLDLGTSLSFSLFPPTTTTPILLSQLSSDGGGETGEIKGGKRNAQTGKDQLQPPSQFCLGMTLYLAAMPAEQLSITSILSPSPHPSHKYFLFFVELHLPTMLISRVLFPHSLLEQLSSLNFHPVHVHLLTLHRPAFPEKGMAFLKRLHCPLFKTVVAVIKHSGRK